MARANSSNWSEETLQNVVAIAWILAHFGTLAMILLLGFFPNPPKLETKEVLTALSVTAPLFAAYTTVMVDFIVGQGGSPVTERHPVSGLLAFISLFFPAVFFVAVLCIVASLVFKHESFQEFLQYLGVLETLFGIYLAKVVKRLFGRAPHPPHRVASGGS